MSSSVCQGLQSCLVEPRVSRLKLALSVPRPSPPPPAVSSHADMDTAYWANFFLQSASDYSAAGGKVAADGEYVHPLANRSSSVMLSERSLEMCTESLGSETGSGTGDDIVVYPISPRVLGSKKTAPAKKMKRSRSFPPPLTTTGVHVRRHREGGRLVLEAVAVAPWQDVFQVERSGGRLRVGVLREVGRENTEEEEEEEGEEVEAEAEVEELEVDGVDSVEEGEEDMDGNSEIAGGEIGSEKFTRPRRCKESGRSNNGLFNWEPFLVAT